MFRYYHLITYFKNFNYCLIAKKIYASLVVAASDSGALSKSANVDGDSPVAIALEAATDTAANNLTAGALFKVLVK